MYVVHREMFECTIARGRRRRRRRSEAVHEAYGRERDWAARAGHQEDAVGLPERAARPAREAAAAVEPIALQQQLRSPEAASDRMYEWYEYESAERV